MALNFKIVGSSGSRASRSGERNRTLLIVDDDRAMLFTLHAIFSRHGWHLLEADSIPAAMKLFEANQQYIDAVVVDYHFDGVQNGLDLVMFAQGRRRGLPCVVISGTWSEGKTPRDEPAKNLFYRAKPFEIRELLDLVSQISVSEASAPRTV